MAQTSTDRLKLNPPMGRMPVLQFVPPAELRIDAAYQRDVQAGSSQQLIRRIAQHWNWDLCQPLVVARRRDLTERLFVVDGQHRLEAARLRGDIQQLPCVIAEYASSADEAASFVHLNQQRRPLSRLELFKAAVASGDSHATAIVRAIEAAGLSLATHTNATAWKPGQLANIGGIEAAWKIHGEDVTSAALDVIGQSWAGKVLPYTGTLFGGIVAICAVEMKAGRFADAARERLIVMLGAKDQAAWRGEADRYHANNPEVGRTVAPIHVLKRAWGVPVTPPAPSAPAASRPIAAVSGAPIAGDLKFKADKGWCSQCDMMVTRPEAVGCKSRFCAVKVAA